MQGKILLKTNNSKIKQIYLFKEFL